MRWDSTLDVAVVAIFLVIVSLASRYVPATLLLSETGSVVYNLFLGVIPTLARFWVLGRLWWLMRSDDGPAGLLAWAFVLSLASEAYSIIWGYPIAGLPYASILDEVAFAVRILGLALLAIALIKWERTPSWVGWILSGYAVALVARSLGRTLLPMAVSNAAGWLWTAFLVALAYAMFRDAFGPARVESVGQ